MCTGGTNSNVGKKYKNLKRKNLLRCLLRARWNIQNEEEKTPPVHVLLLWVLSHYQLRHRSIQNTKYILQENVILVCDQETKKPLRARMDKKTFAVDIQMEALLFRVEPKHGDKNLIENDHLLLEH